MEPIERRLERIDFVKNDVGSKPLPRTHVYKNMLLRLSGQLVIGTNPATSVVPYAPASLIKAVRLILNGEDTIKTFSGKLCFIQNKMDIAVAGELVPPGTTVATHDFSCALVVNFELPAYADAWAFVSRLNSALLSELTMEILFGQETDLVVQGTAVLTIQNCRVEVFGLEYPDVEAQRVYSIFKESTKRQPVTGADDDLRVKITSQNQIISIMLNSVNNSVDADTLVTKVSAVVDGTTFKKVLDWKSLKEQTKQFYRIAPETGIASLVFDKNMNLSDVLRLAGTGSFELVFTVIAPTGTAYIDMLVRELVPYAG